MRLILLALASAGWALVGCSPTTYYLNGPRANLGIDTAAQRLVGRSVTFVDTDSLAEEGIILRLTADTAEFLGDKSDSVRVVPIASVHKFIKPPSTGGKVLGGILGFGAGCALGAMLAEPAGEAVGPGGFGSKGIVAAGTVGIVCIIGGTKLGVVAVPETVFELSPITPATARTRTRSQEEVTVLHVDAFLQETPTSVAIDWRGSPLTLFKKEITIERRTNGKYVLGILKRLLQEG